MPLIMLACHLCVVFYAAVHTYNSRYSMTWQAWLEWARYMVCITLLCGSGAQLLMYSQIDLSNQYPAACCL